MSYALATVVLSCCSTLVLTDALAGISPPARAFRYSLPWAAIRYVAMGCAVALALAIFI